MVCGVSVCACVRACVIANRSIEREKGQRRCATAAFTLTSVGSKKKCEEDWDECLPTHVSLLYFGPIEGVP